ncbi:MAG: bifunctional aldolase/short-chain dehydrogenase [Spirochaetota bacterium]
MKSLWQDSEAAKYTSPLELRVYTSRLLGQESELVLHGGGNTSVKDQETDIFGETHEILYVKGSGWDLATIEKEGFAPVKMATLLKLANLETLSDTDMVKYQRAAMTNSSAPNPSVEAILHAVIPYKFVDHTHSDTVVAITNTENGSKKIRDIYGERALLVPYVMPGFILARRIYEIVQSVDLNDYDAIILLNHGVFTYGNTAKESYERMIQAVSLAEKYVEEKNVRLLAKADKQSVDLLQFAKMRRDVSVLKGTPMLARVSLENTAFAQLANVGDLVTRGPLTPDHVIRTKRHAVVLNGTASIEDYSQTYRGYFANNENNGLTCLDTAPRWGVWPGVGTVSFGANAKDLGIVEDIVSHTIAAIQIAEGLGGYRALPEKDIFEMEYWELEQAKLNKATNKPLHQGKVALVTGAASGIGKACVEELAAAGASVLAVDIDKKVESLYTQRNILPLLCDVTQEAEITSALQRGIEFFGGLDIVVSNAGIFPQSMQIETMDLQIWEKSMQINMSSHLKLLNQTAPFLRLGLDPAIVIVASKNVPAPGIGASAYSAAKAGLTQIARIAALEFAPTIRVNVLHPDAVFDTGIWNDEVLQKRAQNYGLTVEEYKRRNLLKTEISSLDVAKLASEMVGSLFAKVTGAQIPIDGGNERVI